MRTSKTQSSASDSFTLENVDLTGADFSGRRVKLFTVVASRLTACNFAGMQVLGGGSFGAGADYTEYVDCVFDRARLLRVRAGRATFVRCSFRDVEIRELFSHDAEFVDCVFTGRMAGAFFNRLPERYEGSVPNPKEILRFSGNDFSGAALEDVTFRTGIDLSRQILPTGENYIYEPDAEPLLRRALQIAEALPAGDPHRSEVLAAIEVALEDLSDGQTDFFCSLIGWGEGDGEAMSAVVTQAKADTSPG